MRSSNPSNVKPTTLDYARPRRRPARDWPLRSLVFSVSLLIIGWYGLIGSRSPRLIGAWLIVMACVVFANLCRVLRRSYLIGEQGQRLRRGLCPSCGYDLTGNVSGVCPECGGTST